MNAGLESEVHRQTAELRSLNRKLQSLAARNPLTGVYNLRIFRDRLDEQVALAKRYHTPFGLLMIDVDHFKKINDTHGHQSGDRVLKRIAKTIAAAIRNTDILCRHGGEEFVVILPQSASEGAQVAAERIRSMVGDLSGSATLRILFRHGQHRRKRPGPRRGGKFQVNPARGGPDAIPGQRARPKQSFRPRLEPG